jgi:hypothetical protein
VRGGKHTFAALAHWGKLLAIAAHSLVAQRQLAGHDGGATSRFVQQDDINLDGWIPYGVENFPADGTRNLPSVAHIYMNFPKKIGGFQSHARMASTKIRSENENLTAGTLAAGAQWSRPPSASSQFAYAQPQVHSLGLSSAAANLQRNHVQSSS